MSAIAPLANKAPVQIVAQKNIMLSIEAIVIRVIGQLGRLSQESRGRSDNYRKDYKQQSEHVARITEKLGVRGFNFGSLKTACILGSILLPSATAFFSAAKDYLPNQKQIFETMGQIATVFSPIGPNQPSMATSILERTLPGITELFHNAWATNIQAEQSRHQSRASLWQTEFQNEGAKGNDSDNLRQTLLDALSAMRNAFASASR